MDDLLDVEVDLLAGADLELVLQLLDLGALAADDDARARRRDRDARAVRRALDVDLRDARVVELVLDEPPDLDVLVQEVRVGLRREPARAPAACDPDPEADRMRFLTHRYFFSFGLRPVGAAGFFPPRAGARRAVVRRAVAARSSRGDGALARAGAASGAATAPLISSLTPIVRWLVRCLIENARPIARGCTRLRTGPPSAYAWTTRRSSRLRTWWLCSAFATAERSTFSTSRAAARGVYSSVASASATALPRIWSRTSRAFRADTRTNRARAVVRMALSSFQSATSPLFRRCPGPGTCAPCPTHP